MSTPELSFATPAELIAALPHLLGFIPTNDIVALMLGPAHHQAEVPLRAAIRCPASIDPEQAQSFPSRCHLTAAQFPSALLIAVYDPQDESHALRTLHTIRTALTASASPCAACSPPTTSPSPAVGPIPTPGSPDPRCPTPTPRPPRSASSRAG